MAVPTMRIPFVVLLFFLVLLVGSLVEAGDLGSSDTAFRLQVAHSLWSGDPQVEPDDPTFPLGRDGLRQVPWGIGQSLVMLPADVIASAAVSFLALPDLTATRVRQALVGYLTFPLISAAVVAFAILILQVLKFSPAQSAAGGIALLFCTSLLPYTQIHEENSCLLLVDLISFFGVLSRLGSRSACLAMTGAALGLGILTRLTSVLDLAAIGVFSLLLAKVGPRGGTDKLRTTIADFGKYVAPFIILAFAIDRIYQFERFGTWTDTYLDRFAHQVLALNPGLPQNWPWIYPFWHGVYLILMSPERSTFLFDPLLFVILWISLRYWKNIAWPVREFIIAGVVLLAADAMLYARHDTPVGAATWGSRFTTTPVILLSMLAVPLILKLRALLSRVEIVLSVVVVGVATTVQLISVPLWYELEEAQMHDTGSGFVVGMRVTNLAAIILGRFQDWNLLTPSVTPRYLQFNFTPFLMDRYVPHSLANALQLAWYVAAVLALAAAVCLLVSCLRCERRESVSREFPEAVNL